MTREEAIKEIKLLVDTYEICKENGRIETFIDDEETSAFRMAIEALEQEPCEDIISRELVKAEYKCRLEASLIDKSRGIDLSEYANCESFNEFIDSIPPVTPQPKTGHWIFTKTIFDHHGCTAECSSCHKKWKTYDEIAFEKEYNYCFKCGAKMIKPQESESVE